MAAAAAAEVRFHLTADWQRGLGPLSDEGAPVRAFRWQPAWADCCHQEAGMAAKTDSKVRVIAHNRKARFNYQIGETFEVGLALTGREVKSLRGGKAAIAEAYADSRGGEIWLVNANIPEYLQGGRFNHAPKRLRKLLLHRRQINKLIGAVEREGMTLVPLKLYFNDKGRAKLELALARGKKLHDKRETEKKRSWERERGRLLRAKGKSARELVPPLTADEERP